MANIVQLVATGAPSAVAFIKGFLSKPVIGGEPTGSKDSKLVQNIAGKRLTGGITIEPEIYREIDRADVSSQMILSTAGNKRYVSDNVCPQPRTWHITGYISGEIYEVSALFIPSLKKKKDKLRKLYLNREITWFKTRECELVNVVIESIEFEPRADVANKLPLTITLKEVEILTVGVFNPSPAGEEPIAPSDLMDERTPVPPAGSASGLPASTGPAPVVSSTLSSSGVSAESAEIWSAVVGSGGTQ